MTNNLWTDVITRFSICKVDGHTHKDKKRPDCMEKSCSDLYDKVKIIVTEPYIFRLFNDYISTL